MIFQNKFDSHSSTEQGMFLKHGCLNWQQNKKKDHFRIKTTVKVTGVMDLYIKSRYKEKVCVTRNPHVKYENPITCHSKDISDIKVLRSRSNSNIKVIMSKRKVPTQMSCHKKSSNEI
jgi:hypothetical protein